VDPAHTGQLKETILRAADGLLPTEGFHQAVQNYAAALAEKSSLRSLKIKEQIWARLSQSLAEPGVPAECGDVRKSENGVFAKTSAISSSKQRDLRRILIALATRIVRFGRVSRASV
jgi:hypothetical protein